MNNQLYWYALNKVPGVGGATARKLVQYFNSIEVLFEASEAELIQSGILRPESLQAILNIDWDTLESEVDGLHEEEVQLLTWEDESYPEPLKCLSDAPCLLFMRGGMTPDDAKAVAIVGTREPSEEKHLFARRLACSLAEQGYTIVSGLASGIDTAAHLGALEAPQGRTIGVLGSGIRKIHPPSNRELAGEMILRGAVLSEFTPNAPPTGPNLMRRDRIVSGLSQAVLVIEAGEKSGSLDTAEKAKKQGRVVCAMPGSPGTDKLLREGALPIDNENPDMEAIFLLHSERDLTLPF